MISRIGLAKLKHNTEKANANISVSQMDEPNDFFIPSLSLAPKDCAVITDKPVGSVTRIPLQNHIRAPVEPTAV